MAKIWNHNGIEKEKNIFFNISENRSRANPARLKTTANGVCSEDDVDAKNHNHSIFRPHQHTCWELYWVDGWYGFDCSELKCACPQGDVSLVTHWHKNAPSGWDMRGFQSVTKTCKWNLLDRQILDSLDGIFLFLSITTIARAYRITNMSWCTYWNTISLYPNKNHLLISTITYVSYLDT